MVGLGSAGDAPPNSEQPPLVDGIHLRWAFKRELGFPWFGFHLFRRTHDAGTLSWLSQHTGRLPKGPWSSNSIDTPLGRVVSDKNLVLTEDFPPPDLVEFDLADRRFLAVVFPEAEPVRRVVARIGFRSRPGDPPPTKTTITFKGRTPGAGPNSRTENGVVFEARDKIDRPRPNTFIRSIQTASGPETGLGCKFKLNITLPQPAKFVEVMLTGAGRRNAPDGSPTIEAFNQDGTRADIAAMRDPGSREQETFLLAGTAITRVLIDERLADIQQDDDQDRLILNEISFGNATISEVQVTAFAGTTPVRKTTVRGYAGRVATTELEFEGISGVELTSAPAALIDLGTVPLSQGTTANWEKLSQFTYPLRLPITHPDYPCTPQMNEDFTRARQLASDRILYGSPQQFTAPPTPITNAGTISVTNGSPIVLGVNTNWSNALQDAVLQVTGDPTVYTVVMVVSPTKLVLSRNYAGATRSGASYSISNDRFGQFYNYLASLVAGGKPAGEMIDRTLPAPVITSGTVAIDQDSTTVKGTGTNWASHLAGLDFQLPDEEAVYTIASVDSPTQLPLERPYPDESVTGKLYRISARLQSSAATDTAAPRMPAQSPLDMVVLGTLNPAVAQMSGLYWLDRTADPTQTYDYLIVADYNGVAQLNPDTMLAVIRQSGFANVDGSIVYNMRVAQAPALASPDQLEVYALPGSSRLTESGANEESVNNVGLRWNLNKTELGVLLPGYPVMYHLWRSNLGNGVTPSAPTRFDLISKDWPVLVVDVENAFAPPDWPRFPLHALDNALSDGWYSYQVSGIDIFGRHTANSAAGVWRQWAPAPEPRPWYYADPPSNAVIHQSAIRLLTKIAPPPPTGTEAFALDPLDPTVIQDSVYNDWWTRLNNANWYKDLTEAQKKNVIGLRVRWQWPQTQMDQAPHTREFRIYYQPGTLNALLGNTQTVVPAGTESDVTTDIPNTASEDSYVGAALYAGDDAFVITGSEGSPLRVRVRNVGPKDDIAPPQNAPCTIATPPEYTSGLVSVANGSRVVTGADTIWTASLKGMLFQVATDERAYRIESVTSQSELLLEEPYAGASKGDRVYSIRHPRFVDYSAPVSWQRRFHVVGLDQNWTPGTDAAGRPVRNYEIILPVPEDTVHDGVPLTASRTEPIVYAHVGVTAADDKSYTADDPKWTIPWAGRTGNEGRVGPAAKIFRVLREAPPAPSLPPMPELMLATRADQNGASFFTFRWQPLERTMTHVFRAFDDAIFNVDWSQRPRPALEPAKLELFPSEAADPRWNVAKRQEVATELNQLNTFGRDDAGTAQAFAYYRSLSADALRVLAGLPGNEPGLPGNDVAFTQVTLTPLDHDGPANANRRGPDDPDNFQIGDPSNPLASPSLRAFVDSLDGHTTNRHFYRAAYVDAAQNRSAFSLATPPVFLPKVVKPRTPVVTGCVCDDAKNTITWASNREHDLAQYQVYRSTELDRSSELALMDHVKTVAETTTDPASRPAEVQWTDIAVVGGNSYYYRVVAADHDGILSEPSDLLIAKSIDTRVPESPVWTDSIWVLVRDADGEEQPWPSNGVIPSGFSPALRLKWNTSVVQGRFMVTRRERGAIGWQPLSIAGQVQEIQQGLFLFRDIDVSPAKTYSYRITVTTLAGVRSAVARELQVARP